MTEAPDEALKATLVTESERLGFARAGVAAVTDLGRHGDALRRWVAEGHHASMGWMADTLEVRLDPSDARMLAGAKSVLALATPYRRPDEGGGPAPGVVARYARGRDYHNVLQKRARKLVRSLREAGHQARLSVDALPVLERAWAQRAGLGFIGKNCCLIVPGLGSHLFLAAVITTAALPPDEPMAERCGSCRLCLDGCPTDAFREARVLDANRCLSYLTIEHRGPIDGEHREALGTHLFGCDDCQDVCPFNRRPMDEGEASAPFRMSEALAATPLEDFLTLGETEFHERFRGSPLRRSGPDGLARNAALVLGNVGGRVALPVLREAAREHRSEVVREAAAWAVSRIEDAGR